MKMMKKILAAVAVLLVGCAAAFAFDSSEDLMGPEKIDSCTRDEFMEEMESYNNDDYREMIAELFEGEEPFDMGIGELLDGDVQSAVEKQIKVSGKKNDVFLSVALVRVEEGYAPDGGDSLLCYMIFSHFASARDIEHWYVWFSLEMD